MLSPPTSSEEDANIILLINYTLLDWSYQHVLFIKRMIIMYLWYSKSLYDKIGAF